MGITNLREQSEETAKLLNERMQKELKRDRKNGQEIYYLSMALKEIVSIRAKLPV